MFRTLYGITLLIGSLLATEAFAGMVVSDQLFISTNSTTLAEFGNATPCGATVQPCFNPISQTLTESPSGESFGPALIGYRAPMHSGTFNTAVALVGSTGGISDIIELMVVGNATGANQQWFVDFFSAPEGVVLDPPGGLVGLTIITETGGLQDISADFLDSNGLTRLDPLFTIQVQSEVPASVPEPASMILFVSSLSALAVIRRRLRR
jgi:hypothetical protein